MDGSKDQSAAGHAGGLSAAARLLAVISCLTLLAMMVLTFVDVLGRYLFLAPLPAAYEIISLLMPGIIFCALPLTVLRETHVTVDLLDSFIPQGAARIQGVIVNLFSAVALALVAWRLWVKATDDRLYDTATDELLLLIWPFGMGMSVMCGIAALAALANAWSFATSSKSAGKASL